MQRRPEMAHVRRPTARPELGEGDERVAAGCRLAPDERFLGERSCRRARRPDAKRPVGLTLESREYAKGEGRAYQTESRRQRAVSPAELHWPRHRYRRDRIWAEASAQPEEGGA
jgi:hypothetical protein